MNREIKAADKSAMAERRLPAAVDCCLQEVDWGDAIDAIEDLIFVHDSSYRILAANQAYLDYAGMSREEVCGRLYWEVFPLRSGPLPGCQAAIEAELAGERPYHDSELPREESFNGAEAVEEITLPSGESLVSRSFPVRSEELGYLYSIHVIENVTAQHQAERARWDAEAKAWAFAYAAQDAIVVSDDSNSIVFVNPAAEKLLGDKAKNLMGRDFGADFAVEFDSQTPQQGVCEASLRSLETETIPVEVSVAPLGIDGRAHQVHILRDIRERRAAARALRERENQLDYLLANTTEGILVVDTDGVVRYANACAGELFGLAPAEMLGREFGYAVPLSQPQEIEVQNVQSQAVQTVEMRVREVYWEGEPSNLLNLHDITARKQVEVRLRQAAIVFEEAAEGVLITDAEQCIVAVNRAFTQITGYEKSEVLGRKPDMLRSGTHPPEFYQRLWESIHEHGYWSGEIWNRRRNGEIYAQQLTIREVLDENGQCSHYLAVFSDISHVKEYQQQLERMMHLDPLTDLPNRLLFHDRVEQALVASRRSNHSLAVLSVDISDFKAINDSFGHSVGDEVLKQIAARLSAALPDEDTVARLGGDEFGILIPMLKNPEDVAGLIEGLMGRIDHPFHIQGYDVPAATRIGASIYPDKADSAAELLQQADAAMYEAKRERTSYRFFSHELTEKAQERIQLGSELRQALAGSGLLVHYQPGGTG